MKQPTTQCPTCGKTVGIHASGKIKNHTGTGKTRDQSFGYFAAKCEATGQQHQEQTE